MSKNYRQVRKSTVVKNSVGQQFKLGGYRPEKQNSKDKKYSAKRDRPLPPKADLRLYMTPVENQGGSNSCTANAVAGAYEYLANRLLGKSEDVSRLFIYYNARELDGDSSQDEGTYLKSCVKVLRKYGACSENTWSFDLNQILEQPHKQAYAEAANFIVEEAARVDVDLHAMQSCLADGYPFAFGLQLFSSFQQAGSDGLVPMPDPDNEKHDGGHAMLCVGYSDPDQVFIVRNSWGDEWGEHGYCYIPYDYMTKPELNGDCWTIRQVSDRDLSQGIQGSSASLFDGARAAIATAFQAPGAIRKPSVIALLEETYEAYTVEYEEELVYVKNKGFVLADAFENLDLLYFQEDDETDEETEDGYEEESEETEFYEETVSSYEEESDETEDDEETEDSYEEESEEEESEETYETEEESEETEDSYEEESEEEESEETYETEEESEETEDSYEEESEEESEETEDSYEEDAEEETAEESEEIEDTYEEETEESYEEDAGADGGDDSEE
ncbi:peptidase C1 [Phormidesmis priestleyi ULC007]|uniref:Peptidase C1 n=1 Tax=Phormidesmis priestleyi ULC007 TaxID=1920490 RepID=A0A2T1D9S4_9CYAN|nr:C1 family peptidase [Phormidesmis priestleyi]PSB17248.1 peptidase C1 [Phormidesmis priestleyi ULC007]PZO48037.1 MAG: peptidase C1 [Phormidesmis priestleyi]